MTITEDELATRRGATAGTEGPEGDDVTETDEAAPEGDEEAEEAEEESVETETTAEAPKPTPPMQIPLPGDWDTISGDFGGRAPDTSEIRLLGGRMPIEGSFAKGTEIDLLVRVKVTGVLGQDRIDAFGVEEGTVRRHMARMISVKRVN